MINKRVLLNFFAIIITFIIMIDPTFAWFTLNNEIKINSGEGYTATSYFGGGNGSEEKPYIIDNQIHFYNLAWLQYLGYFNVPNSNNIYTQYYFKLTNNLDMSNHVLPPIGTINHPFIGNFEGNNKEISNLSVSNVLSKGNVEKKPLVVTSLTGVNIVGLFGVIGEIGTSLTATYNSNIIAVSNLYLSNVSISSQLSSTLIGMIAGYVNGKVENVGVADSNINIGLNSTPYNNITNNLSDYSLFGFCTDKYKSYIKMDEVNMKIPSITNSKLIHENNGESSGWGGSIDMLSMYNRLYNIYDRATNLSYGVQNDKITITINGDSTTSSINNTGFFKQYYDADNPLIGRFTFSPYDAAATTKTFLYMYGKTALEKTVDTYQQSLQTMTGFRIRSTSSPTTYLSINSNNNTITNSSSEANAVIWAYDDVNRIYTLINGSRLYLTSTSISSISLTSIAPTVYWTYTNNFLQTTIGTSTRYVRYSNGWIATTSTSNATPVLMLTANFVEIDETLVSSSIEANGNSTIGTYFPLNVDSSTYLPKQNNTGYVVGGSNFSNTAYPYKSGDLRVSQYSMNDLSTALGTNTFNNSRLEVVTRTANSEGFVRISDEFNASNPTNNINTTLRSTFTSKTNYTTLGLEKYKASRNSIGNVLSSSSNVYGLHFMDASININNLIVADQILMKKQIYSNFELPENSIDFTLQEKGYINFFAGSYFTGNNSFFALTKIERDAKQKIIAIKEIACIYKSNDASAPYIYQYADGTYSSGSLPPDYSLVFDTVWITNPIMVSNAMYYFEIPVNEGEYALGSAEGKTGAYLLYLDISANAQEINRTQVVDQISTKTTLYEYPLGGAFINKSGDAINATNSVTVALLSNFSGTILFARTNDTIRITSDNSNLYSGYIGKNNTLNQLGETLTATPSISNIELVNRMTWIDYNAFTGVIETTKIEEIIVNNILIDRIYSRFDYTGNIVEGVIDPGNTIDLNGLNNDLLSFYYYYSNEGNVLITFQFEYQHDDSVNNDIYQKIISYTLFIDTNENININITYLNNIYEIFINGSLVTNNTSIIIIS